MSSRRRACEDAPELDEDGYLDRSYRVDVGGYYGRSSTGRDEVLKAVRG